MAVPQNFELACPILLSVGSKGLDEFSDENVYNLFNEIAEWNCSINGLMP